MTRSRRLAGRAAGALAAASVPLWPSAASAQDWTAREDHEVVISSGDTCTISLEASLDEDTDFASAWMGVSGPGDCSAHQQSIHLFVTTTSGQDTFASSFGDGSVQTVSLHGVDRVEQVNFQIIFTNCPTRECAYSYALQPK